MNMYVEQLMILNVDDGMSLGMKARKMQVEPLGIVIES